MKNHVKVKINGILNNSLFKITMIILCCLILSTSIIRTDNFINCMFNGLVIFTLLINIYHLPIVNYYIKKYKKKNRKHVKHFFAGSMKYMFIRKTERL